MIEFVGFGKIPRYSRECCATEKIDGTNAQVYIEKVEPLVLELPTLPEPEWIFVTNAGENWQFKLLAGSKKKWLTKDKDNFGFWAWVYEHAIELTKLGPGHHFGEWWGQGIQRNYGLKERRFSLFNVKKWSDPLVRPACCGVVPVLWKGPFADLNVAEIMRVLWQQGSVAAPFFIRPEGIVIYHVGANALFKKSFENDEGGKEQLERNENS